MENNINQQFNNNMMKQDAPNALVVLIIGIISLALITILSCLGFGFVGFIASVVGFILAVKAQNQVNLDPQLYTEDSKKQLRIGKILNLIGLIIGGLVTVLFVVLLIIGGGINLMEQFF